MKVSPRELYSYLRSRGLSHNHALGWIANVGGESSFDPTAVGDQGTSVGLNQWHGPRKDALVASVPNWETNWKGQIDYGLSEPETKAYLSVDFDSPEDATDWFVRKWERPANPDAESTKRIGFLQKLENTLQGEDTMQSAPLMRSANGQNPLNLDPSAIGLLMGQDVTLEPVASPEPTLAQRLSTDPWLQMGLGILSSRTGSGVGNIASGMQQGLLAARQGELSSQKIRNQAVQNEQRRRQQQLLRQSQLQKAVEIMGGEAMNPWRQHQREQALYRRQQDAREMARTRNVPVMLQHEDTGEKVLAVWDNDTGQYRRSTREGVGEALDSTKYFKIKESGGRGGAEPTTAQRKAAEEKEELTIAADLGDELIDLVQENPWVAGSIGQDIGAAGGYARQIGHQLTRKGADTLGWMATKVGDYLSPEEDQKVRAQFNTKAGLYIKAVRKLASAEQGAVMSEGDINRLNQVVQLKAPDGTDITIVEALKTIKDLLAARGITSVADWQNKLIREGNIEEPLVSITGGGTLPPSGTASPPQANGREVFTTEGGVQYWAE